MPLQSSGLIKLSEIAAEFGGALPHALSEYYGADSGIPASGLIKLTDFYGASASFEATLTAWSESVSITDYKGSQIGTRTIRGFNSAGAGMWLSDTLGGASGNFGSLSNTTLDASTVIQLGSTAKIFTNGTPNVFQIGVIFQPYTINPQFTSLTIPGVGTLLRSAAALDVSNGLYSRFFVQWNVAQWQAQNLTSGIVEII